MESLIANDGMNEIVFLNKKEKIEESLMKHTSVE